MSFNKKGLMSLLSLIVAVPAQAGPTVGTTKGSSKTTISVTLPFSTANGEEIAGGVAVVLALTVCWKVYKALGGTKNFQQFLTEANAQATQAVKARDAAEKLAGGKSYKGLSDAEKSAIIDKSYESYVVDNSARLLGVNGVDFKNYIDSLSGDTFVARMQTAQGVVQTLSGDPRSAIPDAKPGELPFKSALRYAINEKILNQSAAGVAADKFPKIVEVNPATGEGPSGEIGAGIGRGIDNLATGAAQAASNIGTNAYQNLANAAQAVQRQAGLAGEAYSGQVAARAQAAQSNVQKVQSNLAADETNVTKINNARQKTGAPEGEDVEPSVPDVPVDAY